MCGLFGALSSTLTNDEVSNVQFLALLSSTRGIDSTGIAVLGHSSKGKAPRLTVHKELGNSCSFLSSKEGKDAFDIGGKFAILGHTRWATIGAVNLHNAHPIEEDNIILCHNGSIDHFVKDKRSETESDSRELAKRIGKGLVSALRSAGTGAYACTYADLDKRTINLVRNCQRPLCFMFDDNKSTLYWASEAWMLEALAFKKGHKNFCKPESLRIDAVWSFPFSSIQGKVTLLDLEPPKKKEEGEKGNIIPPHKALASPMLCCRFCKRLTKSCICSDQKSKVSVPSIAAEFKGMTYKGYNGQRLAVAAVAPRLKQGCASCAQPATPRDTVQWFDANEFVCTRCAESDDVVKYYLLKDHRVYASSLAKAN